MLRVFADRWFWLSLAVSIVGVSGGAVAFGEHAATGWEDGGDLDGLRVLRSPGLVVTERAPRYYRIPTIKEEGSR